MKRWGWLTSDTRNMIGAAELAMMKPTAILINTSWGQCVNEAALAETGPPLRLKVRPMPLRGG